MKKIFALALLGSTLLLTACGGDSDSSGNDKPSFSKSSNPVKPSSNKDMAEQLNGYWKADCKYDSETGLYKSYIVHLQKLNDNEVLRKEGYRGNYTDSKCVGSLLGFSEFPIEKMNLNEFKRRGSSVDGGVFKAVYKDGDKETYRRISADEFERLKATA